MYFVSMNICPLLYGQNLIMWIENHKTGGLNIHYVIDHLKIKLENTPDLWRKEYMNQWLNSLSTSSHGVKSRLNYHDVVLSRVYWLVGARYHPLQKLYCDLLSIINKFEPISSARTLAEIWEYVLFSFLNDRRDSLCGLVLLACCEI